MAKDGDTSTPRAPIRPEVEQTGDAPKLQLFAEDFSVNKETRETGRVRVAIRTREREALIDEDLARERVEIETVPVGLRIDTIPEVRQQGELTIVPVVEEVLFVERRLMLKEEIHIRRVRTTEHRQEKVMLRHQEAVVSRSQHGEGEPAATSAVGPGRAKSAEGTTTQTRKEYHMAYETIVAVFDTAAHAEAAVKALKAGGFADADISILNEEALARGRKALAESARGVGLWSRLFGDDDDMYRHEAAVYNQVVEKGGVVVSARVLDTEVAHATAILDLNRPIDVHDRAVTSGIATPAHVEAVEKKLDAVPLAAAQQVALPARVAQTNDQVLRLAEEQLQVGKQLVESGRTRVRRFVTERPVSADVTLREEHAEILRKAITNPKYVGAIDWADGEIEVVETAEHALVNKTARIAEEVTLKKIGTDHVETVHDKIRRQEVEVGRVGPDGKIIPGTGQRSRA